MSSQYGVKFLVDVLSGSADNGAIWLAFAFLVSLIAAEMIATNVGLGYMLFVARDFYKTEVIVLGMIVIGVLWLLLDRLLLAPIERATIERWGMVQRA